MARSSTPIGLSAEELGLPAGGPVRAVKAALTRLMDAGLVRVSRQRLVCAVHQNGHGATTAIVQSPVRGAGVAFLRRNLVARAWCTGADPAVARAYANARSRVEAVASPRDHGKRSTSASSRRTWSYTYMGAAARHRAVPAVAATRAAVAVAAAEKGDS